MRAPQEDLKRSFVQMALEQHLAGSKYFSALPGKANSALIEEASREYKTATEKFFSAILAYEQYLLSIERDAEAERELERVLNHKDFVTLVMKVL